MYSKKSSKQEQYLLIALIVLLLLRLLLVGTVPLMDKTESRYAEIARLMLETREWFVLQIDYGVPFWAKPNLSTWLSSLSMSILGVHEFAARLPSYLLHVFLIVLVGFQARQSGVSPYLPGFVLVTTPQFLIHTGFVSTDVCLAFCTVLSMYAFWKAMQNQAMWYWKYLFYIFLGLGILAKGPIALILTLPPIIIWCLLHKIGLKKLFNKISPLIGVLITVGVALPWFLLTEQQSPGFLNYFIIGEHFGRFLIPGWTGDIYGQPKSFHIGMIWVFFLIFAFPWVLLVLHFIWKNRRELFKDPWNSFLIVWMLWPVIFFTLSKNILHTYVLPSIVPMALLVVSAYKQKVRIKPYFWLSGLLPVMVLAATVYFLGFTESRQYLNTDKYTVEMVRAADPSREYPLVCWYTKSYSLQFYNAAPVPIIKDSVDLQNFNKNHKKYFILVREKYRDEFLKRLTEKRQLIATMNKKCLYLIEVEDDDSAYRTD
jgi:4-amino-4-deoxy-L-arabinose transferase-like glycosyltransferase